MHEYFTGLQMSMVKSYPFPAKHVRMGYQVLRHGGVVLAHFQVYNTPSVLMWISQA